MKTFRTALFLLPLVAGLLSVPNLSGAESPAEQLAKLMIHLDGVSARLESADPAAARGSFRVFEEGWFKIEDGVREQSKAGYRTIEEAMEDLKFALEAEPFDVAKGREALAALRSQSRAFIEGRAPAAGASRTQQGAVTLFTLMAHLERGEQRLSADDPSGAASEIAAFRSAWTEVEGLVKIRSPKVYADTEKNMAKAYAFLTRQPPLVERARSILSQMKADLKPYVDKEVRYGVVDAAIILLREGMEALLVVAALLAFLGKTNNADKQAWIWTGCALGVGLSVVIALGINLVFSQAEAGANRELLEGLTGLVAAVMLVYVGYWLHSKSSLTAWRHYIYQKGSAALAKNSLLSLTAIAFLAVFREGAETVLFYFGIAPSIAPEDLIFGLLLGAAGLALVGMLVLVFGMRIPIRPFFLGTSLLLYYLAFKFIGTGVHALQVAGFLSATPADYLPDNGLLGLFPTWETTAAQVAIVLGLAAVFLAGRWRRPALDHAGQPSH